MYLPKERKESGQGRELCGIRRIDKDRDTVDRWRKIELNKLLGCQAGRGRGGQGDRKAIQEIYVVR